METIVTKPFGVSRSLAVKASRLWLYRFVPFWLALTIAIGGLTLGLNLPRTGSILVVVSIGYLVLIALLELVIQLTLTKTLNALNGRPHQTTFEGLSIRTKIEPDYDLTVPLSYYTVVFVKPPVMLLKGLGNQIGFFPLDAFQSEEDVEEVLRRFREAGVKVVDKRRYRSPYIP